MSLFNGHTITQNNPKRQKKAIAQRFRNFAFYILIFDFSSNSRQIKTSLGPVSIHILSLAPIIPNPAYLHALGRYPVFFTSLFDIPCSIFDILIYLLTL